MKHLSFVSQHVGSPDATSFMAIRYEPIAEIGSGGMGNVALARALTGPNAGRFVALKRLYPHLEREHQWLEAFLDEVWLISSLHHPHVVEPLDWGRDEQGVYLAMEFVPGDSLRALVRAREAAQQPLPIEVVAEIVACVAEGLHAAHELKDDRGVSLQLVHRDVSPANVLIGYDGSVKLIDFGVAKAVGKLVHTQHGLIKGKYGYMSPEQLQGLPLDRRSDVFALGVVAWEALTLCRLYDAASEFEIMKLVCEEEPVAPGELRGDVPGDLDRIVLRCLAKDPAARYSSCDELVRDLAPFRPARSRARGAIAEIARASMPERLRWIEAVTGAPVPVPVVEPSPTPTADDTQRSAVLAEVSEDAGASVSGAEVDGSRPARPSTGSDDQCREISESRGDASLSAPSAPQATEGGVDDFEITIRTSALVAEHPGTLRGVVPSSRDRGVAWRERVRRMVLVVVLVAIAVVSSLIGVWLGSR